MLKFGKSKGQGMVEYILIIALIAVMIIAAMKVLSKDIKQGATNVGNTIINDTK